MSELNEIYRYIDRNLDRHIARLQIAVKQKSISHTGEGIQQCAKLWVKFYREVVGCEKASVVQVGKSKWGLEGNPIAYGRYDGDRAYLNLRLISSSSPILSTSGR